MKKMLVLIMMLLCVSWVSALPIVNDASFESYNVADYEFDPAGVVAWTPVSPGWNYWSAPDIAGTGISQELGTFMNPVLAQNGDQAGVIWCPGGEIAQTISGWVAGQQYTVYWYERSRPGYTGELTVYVNSTAWSADHAVSNAAWTLNWFTFTPANANAKNLRFYHSGGWDNMVYIDNVHIVEGATVPEPATLSILGMGILGLLRFRKKA
jgi:hypothetical protein